MLSLHYWPIFVAVVAVSAVTKPMPKFVQRSSGAGSDLSSYEPSHFSPNNVHMQPQEASSSLAPQTASSAFSRTTIAANSEPFFTYIPEMPTDVLKSMLSHKIALKDLTPVRQYLGPAQRQALHDMGMHLFLRPGVTWLHAFGDEPQMDLSFKKRLFVAAPLPHYEWEKAVGMMRTRETEKWLPIVFHKVDVGEASKSHFLLAGIEVIKDPDEAKRVLAEWGQNDTLQSIAERTGRILIYS